MARALTAGTLLAIILVLFGCAGPPSSSGPVHSSFGGGPLIDPQIPAAPYGGGGHNAPWSSPNSLPKGF
jgi:hypothetical protein